MQTEKGVPSPTLFDEDGEPLPPIPLRYIRGMEGDMIEAERRWRESCKWRKENGIDHILLERQVHWDTIKTNYPHFMHGRCKAGHLAYYEIMGGIKIKNLTKQGIGLDVVMRQYIFLTEYIWKYLDPREDDGKLFTVMDLKGISMSDLAGDAVAFVRMAAAIISNHYPERSYKIVLINAPWWFSAIWKIVKPIISENTQKKVVVEGSNYKDTLLKYVDAESLPICFGGTDPTPIMHAPEEIQMREHALYGEKQNHGKEETKEDALSDGALDDGSRLSENSAPSSDIQKQTAPLDEKEDSSADSTSSDANLALSESVHSSESTAQAITKKEDPETLCIASALTASQSPADCGPDAGIPLSTPVPPLPENLTAEALEAPASASVPIEKPHNHRLRRAPLNTQPLAREDQAVQNEISNPAPTEKPRDHRLRRAPLNVRPTAHRDQAVEIEVSAPAAMKTAHQLPENSDLSHNLEALRSAPVVPESENLTTNDKAPLALKSEANLDIGNPSSQPTPCLLDKLSNEIPESCPTSSVNDSEFESCLSQNPSPALSSSNST